MLQSVPPWDRLIMSVNRWIKKFVLLQLGQICPKMTHDLGQICPTRAHPLYTRHKTQHYKTSTPPYPPRKRVGRKFLRKKPRGIRLKNLYCRRVTKPCAR